MDRPATHIDRGARVVVTQGFYKGHTATVICMDEGDAVLRLSEGDMIVYVDPVECRPSRVGAGGESMRC